MQNLSRCSTVRSEECSACSETVSVLHSNSMSLLLPGLSISDRFVSMHVLIACALGRRRLNLCHSTSNGHRRGSYSYPLAARSASAPVDAREHHELLDILSFLKTFCSANADTTVRPLDMILSCRPRLPRRELPTLQTKVRHRLCLYLSDKVNESRFSGTVISDSAPHSLCSPSGD